LKAYTRLSTIHKSTVHSILDEAEIKPFRIKYYCENRGPGLCGITKINWFLTGDIDDPSFLIVRDFGIATKHSS